MEKIFRTEEEAIKYGEEIGLGKHQTENIIIKGKPYLLCGTPLIEDYIQNETADLVIRFVKEFVGVDMSFEEVYENNDIINPVSDGFIEAIEKATGRKVLYVSEEY